MKTTWSELALSDLLRIHDFYDRVSSQLADQEVSFIIASVTLLKTFPEAGRRLPEFDQRIFRLISGAFELRYEVLKDEIIIQRVWHSKEDR
jgi:plasmid stabilization system protein ParE